MKTFGSIEVRSTKIIWSAVLCLFCLLSFMPKSSFSNEYYYQDTYYVMSNIYDWASNYVIAECETGLPEEAEYDVGGFEATVTTPLNQHIGFSSGCWLEDHGEWGEEIWNINGRYGTWSMQTTHWFGQGSCDWMTSTTTSASVNFGPIVNYFYASPTHYSLPGSTTLYWSTSNSTSATINGTAVAVSGSMVVSPNATTTYTLIASDAGFSTQANTTVGVDQPLLPNGYRYSVRHEKGTPPFFPYTRASNETINLANGNLFFTVPLVSRSGRNGLGVDLKLAYNSKIWDFYSYKMISNCFGRGRVRMG